MASVSNFFPQIVTTKTFQLNYLPKPSHFLPFYPQLILITVVSTSRLPPHIYTRIQRRRIVTVTSSCLQRQEVLGINLFWTTFFPQEMLNKHNLHVHTDGTAQQHIVQHIVFVSHHSRANETSMAAWKLQSRSVWPSGMLEAEAFGREDVDSPFFLRASFRKTEGMTFRDTVVCSLSVVSWNLQEENLVLCMITKGNYTNNPKFCFCTLLEYLHDSQFIMIPFYLIEDPVFETLAFCFSQPSSDWLSLTNIRFNQQWSIPY